MFGNRRLSSDIDERLFEASALFATIGFEDVVLASSIEQSQVAVDHALAELCLEAFRSTGEQCLDSQKHQGFKHGQVEARCSKAPGSACLGCL
jgi:hypothetical protein